MESKQDEGTQEGAGHRFHDWNKAAETPWPDVPLVLDETLRDGLQSPSAHDPTLEKKLELLHMMSYLGIDCAALGYPASRSRQYEDVLALANELATQRLPVAACCAARTLQKDIEPIVDISQRSGIPIQVGLFIGSSPIRQHLQGWTLDDVLRLTETSVRFAVDHGLTVLYVTEDTTRASPDTLRSLYLAAIRSGASRLCIADTVGHATPEGAAALVRFVREIVDGCDRRVGIDWHGHRDRGLALANSLAAWQAGAERCHGTALGIGERSGNTPVELLLANLALLGKRELDLSLLPAYVRSAATALGFNVPAHQPLVGRDAFRTATGTHAAAILRAEALGDTWLAERIYSGVPAALVGREQVIEVGPLSGEANVIHWMTRHGITADRGVAQAVLEAAKHSDKVLDEPQILEIVEQHRDFQRLHSEERSASGTLRTPSSKLAHLPVSRGVPARQIQRGAR